MWSTAALVLVLFAGFIIWRKSVSDKATGRPDVHINLSDVDRLS